MEKHTKRVRSPNWNHEHTLALAELKKEASLNKEDGRLLWERIAQTLSSRFPGQMRTGVQCRRRWDTLVKVYNHIEDYCVVTGQDHRELDKGELASMKLDTAYQQDWYDIVEQVCSPRKWNERCDRDLMLVRRSKGSGHSVEIPEHPPNIETLLSASTSKFVTQHDQSTPESTITYAQVSFSPSLEIDKLSPEEEVPRLENGNDGLVLEATQLRQHERVSHEVSQEPQTLESANLLPHTFPAENGAQLKEPLQDDFWDYDFDYPPFDTSVENEQSETESDLTDPFWKPVEYYFQQCSFKPSNEAKSKKASRAGKAPRASKASRASIAFDSVEGKQPSKIEVSTSAGSALLSDLFLSKLRLDDLKTEPTMVSSGDCVKRSSVLARTRAQREDRGPGNGIQTGSPAAQKKAPMSRKKTVPAMPNAASSTSATRREDKPSQKGTERTSKQTALDKKGRRKQAPQS